MSGVEKKDIAVTSLIPVITVVSPRVRLKKEVFELSIANEQSMITAQQLMSLSSGLRMHSSQWRDSRSERE
jgi:hypothetical protein